MDSAEERLKEELRRIDVSRTEPQLLVKLIDKARDIRDNVIADEEALAGSIDEIAKQLIDMNIIKPIKQEVLDLANTKLNETFVAIDGSFSFGGFLHGIYYFPITAVMIKYRKIRDKCPQVIYSRGTDIYGIQEVDSRHAELKASLKMLKLETELLEDVLDSEDVNMVLIDGPVIDPPKKYNLQEYEELLLYRLQLIKEIIEKRKLIVGIIKRITGRLFVDFLSYRGLSLPRTIFSHGDRVFLDAIFSYLHLKNIGNYFYTTPIPPETIQAYSDYKDYGIEVLTTFTQARVDTPPIRIEVVPANEENTIVAAAICINATLPGQPYPMPILIAHEKSLIRKGLAETLFNEVISRFNKKASNLSKILRLKHNF